MNVPITEQHITKLIEFCTKHGISIETRPWRDPLSHIIQFSTSTNSIWVMDYMFEFMENEWKIEEYLTKNLLQW